MVLSEFRDRIYRRVQIEGGTSINIDDTQVFNSFINERLTAFVISCELFSSARIPFTPIVGEDIYDLRGTSFQYPIYSARHIIINGTPLQKMQGCLYGASTEENAIQLGVSSTTNGMPTYFWFENPSYVMFDKPFDQVYPNCFVAGNYLHPTLSDDNDPIILSYEAIEPASKIIAADLIENGASGEGIANANNMRSKAMAEIFTIKSNTKSNLTGKSVRGFRTGLGRYY